VLGINAVTAAERDDLPPLLRDAATDTIAAIGALDSELIVFLRAARLLPDDVLARLDREQAAL
jgi:chemotaxis signal transduction protein